MRFASQTEGNFPGSACSREILGNEIPLSPFIMQEVNLQRESGKVKLSKWK